MEEEIGMRKTWVPAIYTQGDRQKACQVGNK